MKIHYAHITKPKNLDRIMSKGLRANEEGLIYLFNDLTLTNTVGVKCAVCDLIAHEQVFLKEYIILSINAQGITGTIEQDVCGELTTKHQYVLKQNRIDPKFIEHVATVITNPVNVRHFIKSHFAKPDTSKTYTPQVSS